MTLEPAGTGEDGIGKTGLAAGVFQPVGVAALVAEPKRIGGNFGQRQDFELSIVKERFEPRIRRHAHVVTGARDDELVRLQILVIDHLPRFGAFDP